MSKQIMQQILKEHVDQHNLTKSIMQRSVQTYLDQADPDHTYLLQSEVDPFWSLPDGQMAELMAQYKQDDYSFFRSLDKQIQASILRVRDLRKVDEKDLPALFAQAKATTYVGSRQEFSDMGPLCG